MSIEREKKIAVNTNVKSRFVPITQLTETHPYGIIIF